MNNRVRCMTGLLFPLHQVSTCIEWTPPWDRSRLNNAPAPQFGMYCTHHPQEPLSIQDTTY